MSRVTNNEAIRIETRTSELHVHAYLNIQGTRWELGSILTAAAVNDRPLWDSWVALACRTAEVVLKHAVDIHAEFDPATAIPSDALRQ